MSNHTGDLAGRTVAITGASNGIGRAAAIEVACRGARVALLVRDRDRGEAVRATITELTGDDARSTVVQCDLARLASVSEAAAQVLAMCPTLDVLANNAGLIAPERIITVDGNELTFQVNHLSHFLLTGLLMPALQAASGRVINVSSDAHFSAWKGLRFDDLGLARGWSPFRAYAHSKLANVVFTYELARRLQGSGVCVNAMHPGVVRSGFGASGWGVTGKLWELCVPKITSEQGADTLVHLIGSPEVEGVSAGYFFRRELKRSSPQSHDAQTQHMLWEMSERMTGAGKRD